MKSRQLLLRLLQVFFGIRGAIMHFMQKDNNQVAFIGPFEGFTALHTHYLAVLATAL